MTSTLADARQSDQHQLTPIADAIEANLGRKPAQLSADAGYCSEANLAAMEQREIDAYIAPGRAKHAGEGEGGGARVAAMREKIKAGGHLSAYRLRKQLPEPVFGQIKQARSFRQFQLRGGREGRRRMGRCLHRPQCFEAGPRVDSVRRRRRSRITSRNCQRRAAPLRASVPPFKSPSRRDKADRLLDKLYLCEDARLVASELNHEWPGNEYWAAPATADELKAHAAHAARLMGSIAVERALGLKADA